MPDMKQRDIKNCESCERGVMHNGMPIFYRVKVETMGIDRNAVMRQHGLELHMGGGQQGAALASVLGTDPIIAKVIVGREIMLCQDCMMKANAGVLIGDD